MQVAAGSNPDTLALMILTPRNIQAAVETPLGSPDVEPSPGLCPFQGLTCAGYQDFKISSVVSPAAKQRLKFCFHGMLLHASSVTVLELNVLSSKV